jgi:predicted acetyltransferase
MFSAPSIRNAGVFDATKVTTFGSKSGSWRDAFAYCYALENLYIKNLKVAINISWSPINQDSIEYILSNAANTTNIKIYLSPYTWYRLTDSNKTLATEKNITLELIDTNYIDDVRLNKIKINGDGTSFLSNDGTYKSISLPTKMSNLENDTNFVSLETVSQMIDDAIANLKNELIN